jgi:Zn-dependent peptidase ImmA (M78 family)/DNA-binding XRE family transcriptional regulator
MMKYDTIDLVGLSERLTAARRAANITQEEAATSLEMSRPTFIAIEKGTRRPKPDELVKLAELYRLPLNKLLREDAQSAPLRPHLRSVLDNNVGAQQGLDEAVEMLSSYIDDYLYLEKILEIKWAVQFPPPVRVPSGPIERFAEHCAQEERTRLNVGSHQPIYTLRKILEEAGLHIFFEKLDSKLAGLYVFAPQLGYCILINQLHPRERRRWTIAHEHAHFLLDRDRPGVDFLKPTSRKPENERFADAFAAAFLMPEAGVRRRFYEEVERTGDFRVGDFLRMADYFGVSAMAMALRLEAIGLIPKGSWDQISESRVQIRDMKNEAGIESRGDDDSVDHYPQRYKLLAVQAFNDGKITEGQLAKFLRCSRIEAREIVDECSGTKDDVNGDVSFVPLTLSRSLLNDSGK